VFPSDANLRYSSCGDPESPEIVVHVPNPVIGEKLMIRGLRENIAPRSVYPLIKKIVESVEFPIATVLNPCCGEQSPERL